MSKVISYNLVKDNRAVFQDCIFSWDLERFIFIQSRLINTHSKIGLYSGYSAMHKLQTKYKLYGNSLYFVWSLCTKYKLLPSLTIVN